MRIFPADLKALLPAAWPRHHEHPLEAVIAPRHWAGQLAGIGVLAIAMLNPAPARAQWAVECVNCADWWTQLTQYAEEIDTAVNTLNAYEEQILMYENMIKQGLALPESFWGTIQSDINGLNSIVATGQNIAYATANIATKYPSTFPSYATNMSTTITQTSASNQLSAWAQQNYDAASTSLLAASQQSALFDSENGTMSSLQSQSQSASGAMQALQSGNEMAAQEVQQLQKLRQLVMTQIDIQSQAIAEQTAENEQQRAIFDQFLSDPSTVPTTGQSDTGGLLGFPTN